MQNTWTQTPAEVKQILRTYGTIGTLESLAGIEKTREARRAFWREFDNRDCTRSGHAVIDDGVVALEKIIHARVARCELSLVAA